MVYALDSAELKNQPQNQQIGYKIFAIVHHGSPFFTYSLSPWHHHQFGGFHLSLSDVAVCMRDVVLTPGLNAPPIPCPHLN